MKKPSCYNPNTFLSCDTNCYSTDYTVGKHTNSDSLWYSIDLAVNYTNSFCGTTGGSCLNKSNIYTPTSTVLASQPAGPSDVECEDKCFWKLTGNSISDLYDDKSSLYPFYMGTRTPKDVVFKRNGIEKMRLGVEGLGVGQKNPAETMHVGDFFTFHTGANFYSFGYNDYYAGDGIRKRWENRSIGSPEPQFSGALTFYSSQYNGDGVIELGTAGLGIKDEVLNYTESNNGTGHNQGYKGLNIRPSYKDANNNVFGLIGLGTFPNENTTRVLIKGMGTDNNTSALNVTDNTGYSKFIVKDNGNVGIGTITPKDIFQVGDELTYTNYSKQFLFNAYVDYSVLPANPYKFINPTNTTNGNKTALVIGLGGAGKGADILVDQGSETHTTADFKWDTPQGLRILPKGSVISITPEILAQGGLIGINHYFPTSTLHIKGAGNTNATSSLNIENTNGSILFVQDNGNVGIGTNAPTSKLFVKANTGTSPASSVVNVVNSSNNSMFYIGDDGKIGINTTSFSTAQNSSNIKLKVNGDVLIGTQWYEPPLPTDLITKNRLSVDGQIVAKEMIVNTNNWADFVFDKNYKLATLEEVENHINENKHLKGIPTETEIKNNGVDIGAMNVMLLQKVEELTLYMIQLKKESNKLSRENKEINEKLNKIKRK